MRTVGLVIALVLGSGGIGTGVISQLRQPSEVSPEVVKALSEISAKLTVMDAKMDRTTKDLDKHDERISALEKKVKP